MGMGISGRKGAAKVAVGEQMGSQVKNTRWLEEKVHFMGQEGRDVEKELRIGTQRIQTPGWEQSKEMSWLLGEMPRGVRLMLERGVFKKEVPLGVQL